MPTTTATKVEKEISKLSPAQLRVQLRQDVKWLLKTKKETDSCELRVAFYLNQVRRGEYWREWEASNGKLYESFTEWIEAECDLGRSTIYSLMDVAENLADKLSMEEMVKLGKTACYELARVGRHKPSALPKVIAHINRAEDREQPLSSEDVKQVCANALAGQHLGSRKFVTMEFMVPADSALNVRKALAVMDAMEPVEEPKTAIGMGLLLAKIATDYTSGNAESKVLAQLEKAGMFEASRFKLVE